MHAQAAEDLRAEMDEDAEKAKSNAKVASILAAGGLPAVSRTRIERSRSVRVFAFAELVD